MMDNEQKNREALILDAARSVFIRKGFTGSTMQEIADEAKINKSLLHYYFRSKEKLFGAVFSEAFKQFMPKVGEIMSSETSFFDKIRAFVETYLDLLIENPYLPGFILHEINRNPEWLIHLFKNIGLQTHLMISLIENEIQQGNIRPINPYHFIGHILSLCVFPFISKPLLQEILLPDYKKEFRIYIEERKKEIPDFIIQSISKK